MELRHERWNKLIKTDARMIQKRNQDKKELNKKMMTGALSSPVTGQMAKKEK